MLRKIIMCEAGEYTIPVAYQFTGSRKPTNIKDILSSIPTEKELVVAWGECDEDLKETLGGVEYIPVLCCTEGEDDVIPYMTVAYDGKFAVEDVELTDDIKSSLKDALAFKDDEDIETGYASLYSGLYMSYLAYLIRQENDITGTIKKEGYELSDILSMLKEEMDSTEDDTYMKEYEMGVALLENSATTEENSEPEADTEESEAQKEESEEVEEQTSTEESERKLEEEVVETQIPKDEDKDELKREERKALVRAVQEEQAQAEESVSGFEDEVQEEEEDVEEADLEEIRFKRCPNYYTEKSGKAQIIQTVSKEEQEQVIQALSKMDTITDLNLPAFIPNIRKYELPIGVKVNGKPSVLAGMTFEEFWEQVHLVLDFKEENLVTNPILNTFVSEINYILQLDRTSTTLRDIVTILDEGEDAHFGTKAFYELLTYEVLEESPNNLYNNMYYLLYMIDLHMSHTGVSEVIRKIKVANTLTKLACKVLEFEAKELIKKDADDIFDEGESAGFSWDKGREVIRQSGEALSSLLVDVICATNGSSISCDFSGGDSLENVQIISILGTYGYTFNIVNYYLQAQGLGLLNVYLKEYDLTMKYFGEPVSTQALGYMLVCMRQLRAEIKRPKSKYYKMPIQEFEEEAKKHLYPTCNYDRSLMALSSGTEYMGFVEKNLGKKYSLLEEESIANKKYEFKRVIVGAYKKDGDTKFTSAVLGIILEDNTPGVTAKFKYALVPVFSSLFKPLLEAGYTIPTVLEDSANIREVGEIVSAEGIKTKVHECKVPNSIDKSCIIVRGIKSIPTSVTELQAILGSGDLNGIPAINIRIPDWVIRDSSAISMGYKTLKSRLN